MLPFSDSELYEPVQRSLEKVRPHLLRDSGDIELQEIKGGKVYVRLLGACQSCSASHITLKRGVEQQLKRDIHPDMEVIEVR